MAGWFIAAGLLAAGTAALIWWQAWLLSRCRFWCKNCGQLFALPAKKLIFRQHSWEDWWLTCPRCGKKGWCRCVRAKPKEGEDK